MAALREKSHVSATFLVNFDVFGPVLADFGNFLTCQAYFGSLFAYFGGYLNKNLIETQAALNLSYEQVKTLLVNSFKSSFLKDIEKKKCISKI